MALLAAATFPPSPLELEHLSMEVTARTLFLFPRKSLSSSPLMTSTTPLRQPVC
jgi:hypothetical protein